VWYFIYIYNVGTYPIFKFIMLFNFLVRYLCKRKRGCKRIAVAENIANFNEISLPFAPRYSEMMSSDSRHFVDQKSQTEHLVKVTNMFLALIGGQSADRAATLGAALLTIFYFSTETAWPKGGDVPESDSCHSPSHHLFGACVLILCNLSVFCWMTGNQWAWVLSLEKVQSNRERLSLSHNHITNHMIQICGSILTILPWQWRDSWH